jgi:hypothetical protein
MIKKTSSSPNPLTIVILTYKRNDSATDVIGMNANAACLRTSEAAPTAPIAAGSMNIESDIQKSGPPMPEGRLYVKNGSRAGSLPYDGGLRRQTAIDKVRPANNLHP